MSCDSFEELIALDVGGDLAPAEAARLEAHLEACAACRELARALEESQAALKSLSDASPDADALTAWRREVMARIDGAEPRRGPLWRWAWAAAAAMVVLAGLIGPRLLQRTPPAPAVGQAVALAPPVAQAVPPAAGRPNGLPHHPRHRRPPAPAPEPLLVKLETSDPNVVIYWILEGKGN